MTPDLDGIARRLLHDVRSLVRKASLDAQLLQRSLGGNCQGEEEFLTRLLSGHASIELLLRRVGILLDAMRPGGRSTPMPVGTALTMAVQSSWKGEVREDGSAVEMCVMPDYAVPGNIAMAVSELIDNAVRFRAAGRPLHVRVDAKVDAAGALTVSVVDNGEGWDERYTEKMFRPFETLLPGRSGFGLGLAISRAVAESNGGQLTAHSSPEGGSFSLTLPAA
jgi:signal transduction histidine kinase